MKKIFKKIRGSAALWATIIVGLFIVFSGSAYYLGKRSSSTPVSNDEVSPAQTQNNTQSIKPAINNQPSPVSKDETAGWKTYQNNELGFLFKYPSILSLNEKLIKELGNFLTVRLMNNYLDGAVFVNDPGRGYENFQVRASLQKITIGGVETMIDVLDESTEYVKSADAERAVIVKFDKGDNRFFIIFTYKKIGPDQEALVKNILSTFQFTK